LLNGFFQKPQFFKFLWADITQIGMTLVAVIKHFNIVNDVSPRFVSGPIVWKKDPLGFEAAKKTFCNSIIPTISFSAHATDHTMGFQHFLEISAAILTAPV